MAAGHTINGKTATYGIIGSPVRHSLSPAMHNAAFAALGLNCVYIPLPTDDPARAVEGLRALGFRGASVTIPHKEAVMELVDELDPVAARIGAVNTLVIDDDGEKRIHGYNTDWIGANRALEEKIDLKGSRALLLGAGGSARAIGYGLLEAGASVTVANRTITKGEKLARRLGCPFVPLDRAGEVEAEILVNTTSVGMEPRRDATPLDQRFLKKFSVVMDIVYAPLTTRLLREAAAEGCAVVDGLSMLLYQGAAQFELWTGREAPVAVMAEVLRHHLADTKENDSTT